MFIKTSKKEDEYGREDEEDGGRSFRLDESDRQGNDRGDRARNSVCVVRVEAGRGGVYI